MNAKQADTPQGSPGNKLWSPVLIALAILIFAFVVWRSYFLIDDAFISFRYAKNWAAGHGPVFNLGVEPPVEGYSNFSWVVLLTLGALAGASPVVLSNVLSILAALATLLLAHRFMRRQLELDEVSAGLATLALAAYPCFGVWATGGLETAFFGLLLFGAWMLLCAPKDTSEIRRGLLAGLVGIVLVLTRVEGVIWIGGLVLASSLNGRRDLPIKRMAVFVAVVISGMLPHLLWRHATYGEWVANTIHAKSGFSGLTIARGARYLATWGLLFLWPVLAIAGAFTGRNDRQRALGLSALLMVLGTLAYNLAVGGDWMPMFRFVAPASAFFAVLFGMGLQRLAQTPRAVAAVVLIVFAALPIFDASPIPESLLQKLYFRDFKIGYQSEWYRWETTVYNTDRNTWRGRAVKRVTRPGESWTGGAIGATGYYSDLFIYDRNGLVNREVAAREVESGSGTAGHEKRVPRSWFRSQAPTYYKIFVAAEPIKPGSPKFNQFVQRYIIQQNFSDPAERVLTECTVVRIYPIIGLDPLPEHSSLVALEHTDSPEQARAFWSRHLKADGPRGD